jgi:PAS domain S-box-containing protein
MSSVRLLDSSPEGQLLSDDARECFFLAMEEANDGFYYWNMVTGEVYLSPRWKEMLGYTDAEIPNHVEEWIKRLHPEDLERAKATLQHFLDGDLTQYRVKFRLRHKDGTYRWILSRGTTSRDATGKPVRLAGWHIDITERKHIEGALQESVQRLHAVWEAASDAMVLSTSDGTVLAANPAYYRLVGFVPEDVLGKNFTVIFPEEQRAHAQAEYEATFQQHISRPPTEASIIRADGTQRIVESSYSFLTNNGTRTAILSIIRDITDRKKVEKRLELQTRELALLLQISHTVASTLELKPLLGTILEQLKTVVDYSGAAIYSVQEKRIMMLDYRGPITLSSMQRLCRDFERSPAYEQIRQGREAAFSEDLHQVPDFVQAFQRELNDYGETVFEQFRSWIGVPLIASERVIGLVTLHHSRPQFYTLHHANLAFALANQAAVALENARLYEQAQSLAAMQERQRLARELHDSVSQELYGINLSAHSALEAIETDPAGAVEAMQRVIQYVEAGQAEMHALIFELRPESLETEGLVAALEKQVLVLRTRHRLTVEAFLGEEPDIALERKHAMYRIVQEALHNVVKHARATTVTLRLAQEERMLVLEVSDNGRGFDTEASFPGHFGLRSMQERAASLGGTLSIMSAAGQGTCVLTRVPRRDVEP